jgi:hypothetical protein
MTSPQPLSDLTPPSPTGRGRKYGEKRMVEKGFLECNFLPPFSDPEKGQWDEVK